MGRPRSVRSDLPDGLYLDPRRGTFYIRTSTVQKQLGRVDREQAIAAWVKLVKKPVEAVPAAVGTFAALVDDYVEYGLPLVGAESTRKEYARQAPKIKERWGKWKVARKVSESENEGVLTPGVFTAYLNGFRLPGNTPKKGGVMANQDVRLASTMFTWAVSTSKVFYHAVQGAKFIQPKPSLITIPDDVLALILEVADPTLRCMVLLDRAIGARIGDIRLLRRISVLDDVVVIVSGKTKVETHFERTPELDAIINECTKLRGTIRSLEWMFVTRKAKPYTVDGVSKLWAKARKKAIAKWKRPDLKKYQFRQVRKTAINAVHEAGQNATDFAGHKDERTTRRHYLVKAKRVKPAK